MRLVTAGQDGFPRREFQTHRRPVLGQWVPRIVSHLGSIDPTISSLAAPAQPVRRTRPTDLLSGGGRCTGHPRAVVTLACRHQLPGDAGSPVGERHRCELRRLALQQGDQPRRRMAAAVPRLLDHRGCSRHQHAAQPLVSGAGDLAEPGLAGGGMVFRGQPEPGRKMPAGGERARIGTFITSAVAPTGPTPGIFASRRLSSLARCQTLSLTSIAFNSTCNCA